MRTFVVTKNGIARIFRTYALDEGGWALIDAVDGAPHMADLIANKWHAHHRAQVTNVREITEADIPGARSVAMRDAWEDDGSKIIVNMVKARTHKTDEIRVGRDARLAQTRTDHQDADIDNNVVEKARLAQKIRTLRDLPTTIQPALEAITTPEALETYEPPWPE